MGHKDKVDNTPSVLNGKEALWYVTGKSSSEIPAFGKTAHEAHSNATPHLDSDDTYGAEGTEVILARKKEMGETIKDVLLDCLRIALNEKHTLNKTLGDAQQANTELRARATTAEAECVRLQGRVEDLLSALELFRRSHVQSESTPVSEATPGGETQDSGVSHPQEGVTNGQVPSNFHPGQ